MSGSGDVVPAVVFAGACERFKGVLVWLQGSEAAGLEHGALESRLEVEGRELLRQLLQGHLDLRAQQEVHVEVTDAEGAAHRAVEAGHERALGTVFGQVTVSRRAYRRRGHTNLHPADAGLNLPVERHSHGLRRLAALEAARASFQDAADAIEEACGQRLGKRQVEELAGRAAADFEEFYASRPRSSTDPGDVLVISVDGKGIVMRPDALRPATQRAAKRATTKLATRLSKGEKRNRKRMAEVGSVHDITPMPRTPADIIAPQDSRHRPAPGPTATNKWLVASVVQDAQAVVSQAFDEAERRDAAHKRTWLALVDGNNHQIDRIRAEAADRDIDVAVIVDFIHVLEYLWRAAWSFYNEGDPAAENWVRDKATAILDGQAKRVAAAVRRKATYHGLDPPRRANADTCANYLRNKAAYLDYPTALARGWPIATGVIEGACRHLVKDRMDITGARWGLNGAETVLKLRALRANGDFDTYWQFHLNQERQRVHQTHYAHGIIPTAA
jgi:hypothetical protein